MEANESLAYIAGIFDGEGTTRISVAKGGSANIYVRIYNTCEELIDYIDLCIPGSQWTRGRMKKYPNYSDVHSISWFGQKAIDVLELLLPYLIVKRSVAETVIEFYSVCIRPRAEHRSRPITEAERILRESYKARVGELNSHGRHSAD